MKRNPYCQDHFLRKRSYLHQAIKVGRHYFFQDKKKKEKKDFNTSIKKYCKLDFLYFQYLTMYVKYLAPFVKILLRLAWKMLKPAELWFAHLAMRPYLLKTHPRVANMSDVIATLYSLPRQPAQGSDVQDPLVPKKWIWCLIGLFSSMSLSWAGLSVHFAEEYSYATPFTQITPDAPIAGNFTRF